MAGTGESAVTPCLSRKSCLAHDLLWLKPDTLSQGQPLPSWVRDIHTDDMPVIVRRDYVADGRIPVGIRGRKRSERAATWVRPQDIIRKLSPEDIITSLKKKSSLPFGEMKPIQCIEQLLATPIPEPWGITGSCAFALATGRNVMHQDSDLDLLIRCHEPVGKTHFKALADILPFLPCRTDIQIETPAGTFALKEWMQPNNCQVLLKTDYGPLLTVNPWQPPHKEKAQQWRE